MLKTKRSTDCLSSGSARHPSRMTGWPESRSAASAHGVPTATGVRSSPLIWAAQNRVAGLRATIPRGALVLVRLDPFPVRVAVWVQPARRLCSVVTPINHEFSCGATCFADIPVALAIRPSCDRASAGSRPSKQPRAPSGRGTGSTLRPRRPDPRRARASARRRASRVDWWPRTTTRRWRCAPPQARRGCAVLVERRSRTPQHHTFCSANMCARHRRGPGKRHARQGPDSRRVGGRSGTAQARGSSTCHPWSALAQHEPKPTSSFQCQP